MMVSLSANGTKKERSSIAVVSSGIPIGEIVALVKIGLNAHEIYQAREKFEADISGVLLDSLNKDMADLRQRLVDHQLETMTKFNQYQTMQLTKP